MSVSADPGVEPAVAGPARFAAPAAPGSRPTELPFTVAVDGGGVAHALAAFVALLSRYGEGEVKVELRTADGAAPLSVDLSENPSAREVTARAGEVLERLWADAAAVARFPLLARAAVERGMAAGIGLRVDGDAPVRGALSIDPARIDAATAHRLPAHFRVVREAMVAAAGRGVLELPLFTPAERAERARWNATDADLPHGVCLHQAFEARVDDDPLAVAVVHGDEAITYGELEARANRLAHHLRRRGVGPESRVGICVERGPRVLEAILGILKAGGAYVPLDPTYPAERLAHMQRTAGVRALVTERALAATLDAADDAVLLDRDAAALEAESAARPGGGAGPENLAYVIFTSGSTGHPKGIALRHRGVMNNLADLNERHAVGPADRVLLLSSLSFDMSVYETLGILAAGGAAVIPRPHELREPLAWAALCRRHAVTLWNSAPALLGMLCDQAEANPDEAPSGLRLAYLGGDWVPVPLVERVRAWAPAMRDFIVMGGATEASIHSIIYPVGTVDPAWRSIPYGVPMANQRAYVLDGHLRAVPTGVAGELFLGGIGLARGYTGRAGFTAERFLPAPHGGEPGARIYRTGDLARYGEDGTIELLGRIDHQVKIRGFRIEAGEVETALRRHPGVARAVVAARADGGESRLVAYVVPDAANAPLLARLLALQAGPGAEGAAWSQLPNGLPVAHLNARETEFSFREVWGDQVYLQNGITVQDGDCVFDVGANIGLFSLLVGREWAGVRVFAFEPIPPVFQALRLNAELHGIDATLFNCGLSSRSGSATFTYYPHVSIVSGQFADPDAEREVIRTFMRGQEAHPGAAGSDGERLLDELVDARLERREVACELRTLSEVVREHGVERIDLLKVDVERSEEVVLAGIAEHDWAKIRQVVVEVYDRDGRLDRIRALLEGHGFVVEMEQDRVLEQTPFYNLFARRLGAREPHPAPREGGVLPAGEWTSAAGLAVSLREHLRARLPDYMVPAAFVVLDRLPLSPNGKVDRGQLPAPSADAERAPYAAPRTPVEAALAEIWAEVLGIGDVGTGDDFFALGGHSLAAARVAARVREKMGVQVALGQIFGAPTVAELATALGRCTAGFEAAPIPRSGGEGPFPLAPAQRRLWLWDQLNPGAAAYNIPVALRLRGPLDVPVLERALGELVARHAVLRTAFELRDGAPVQVILPPSPVSLRVEQLPPSADADAALRDRLAAEGSRPFDLAAGRPFRALLTRTGDEEHILLLTFHHIASDGWSTRVLLRELSTLYDAFGRGEAPSLAALPLRYADYAVWHRDRLEAVEAEQLAWWHGHLAGAPELLELPLDRPRPAVQSHRGAQQPIRFPAELVERARALGREEGATLHLVILAALNVVLARHARAGQVVVGSAHAGRTHPDTEPLAGFFVNILPVHADLAGDPDFRAFLRRVRASTLEAYDRPDIPFDRLVDALVPGRSRSYAPLVQVAFAYQDAPARGFRLGAARAEPVPVDLGSAQFDLTFRLDEDEDGVAGVFEYATDLFEPATARRIADSLCVVLESAVSTPGRPLSRLALQRDDERARVLRESGGAGETFPVHGTLHHRFEAQAAARAHEVAVTFEGERLTYGELNARANRLARRLRALGVGPEERVGLCAARSLDLVVGILAILKAGGAYLPLDPAYPAERLAYMAADSGIRILLAQAGLRDRVPSNDIEVVSFDAAGEPADGLADDLGISVDPAGLAYVIYTSGSTGRPKGVGVTHGNVLRLFACTDPSFRFGAEDAWTLFHSSAFDFSVWEIWGALLHGGRLVVVPWEVSRDPAAFRELLRRERVTVLNQTPSAFRALAAADERAAEPLPHLRAVVFGGEALQYESLRGWLDRYGARRPRLVNMYGITETTVHVTWHTVTGAELRHDGVGSGVGRPIPDLRTYVLEPGGEPAPAGVPGELHVGGAGVARGYLGRPGLTADRFVPDPFSGQAGARLYRSGDLVRWKDDGTLEYRGRIDQQVKVRGFRIEIGEIESLLLAHPGVGAAAVIVRGEGDDAALAAYFVAAGEAPPPAELRDALKRHLPEYMVPATFIAVARIPLTANGKLDRAALPAPNSAAEGTAGAGPAAPRTPVEEVLAGIFAEVLRRERVGVRDDFFEMGGHSLLATRVVSRLREALGAELSVRALFEAPTVAELAGRVEAVRRGGVPRLPPVVPVGRGGPLPLSSAQERLWFLHRMEPESAVYNVPAAVRLDGAVDVEALERALGELVRRHEALRTTFREVEGGAVQAVAPFAGVQLPVEDLASLDQAGREAMVLRRTAENAARPFDLMAGPLFRASLLRLSAQEHVLLLCMHHVVCDEWSLAVLFPELGTLYTAFRHGTPSPLPEPAVQYGDYAAWEREQLRGGVLNAQLAYWKEALAGAPALLELPADRPPPAAQTYRGARERFDLSVALLARLEALARTEGASLYMVLLGAFQALLSRISGSDDVVVGSPIAVRTRRELEDVVGFFANTVVLRTDLSGDPSFREVLRRVRAVALGAYEHQDVPFERVVEALQPGRSLSHSPLFQVMFVQQDAGLEADGLGTHRVDVEGSETSKFDLTLFVAPHPEGIRGSLEYSTDLFDRSTIQRMTGHLRRLLEQVAEDADVRLFALELMDAAERGRVTEAWNATEARYPPVLVHHRFEAQAERTPDAAAVVHEGASLTYRELNQRANRLAHHLAGLGVGPEVAVGICLRRGPEMIVAVLAVLKAGGAYVPLDPGFPAQRLALMAAGLAAPVLLTQQSLRGALPVLDDVRVVCVDAEAARIAGERADDPAGGAVAANLAYVLYTSGSTGTPKGVAMPHEALANLVAWHLADDTLAVPRTTLQFASLSFDVSFQEIAVTLASGGTLVLVDEDLRRDADRLLAYLAAHRVERLFLPFVALQALAEAACQGGPSPALREVVTAGEQLVSTPPVAALLDGSPGARLINHYGPTETHVATAHALPARLAEWSPLPPIGAPVANTRTYVLDAALRPAPVGVPGELYIGGVQVARGYLGRPGLTAERFVPDPFARGGARMYRTGDRARWLAAGELEYLGRADQQVKIRGFRVEPGEVEAVLRQHPGVADCAVVACDDEAGPKRLVAYVAGGADPAELRAHLRRGLPEYMVPAAFVALERLPLTPSGKLDRRALPAPGQGAAGDGYVAPRTPEEEAVAAIWAGLLRLERVGAHDDFFELGGHSLLATRVVSRIRQELGVELPLRALFESPTVEGLARLVSAGAPAAADGIAPIAAAASPQSLLAALDDLSEDEIDRLLAAQSR